MMPLFESNVPGAFGEQAAMDNVLVPLEAKFVFLATKVTTRKGIEPTLAQLGILQGTSVHRYTN